MMLIVESASVGLEGAFVGLDVGIDKHTKPPKGLVRSLQPWKVVGGAMHQSPGPLVVECNFVKESSTILCVSKDEQASRMMERAHTTLSSTR